jgi:hypothetical protein
VLGGIENNMLYDLLYPWFGGKRGSAAFSQLLFLDTHLKSNAVSNTQLNFEPDIVEDSSAPEVQES